MQKTICLLSLLLLAACTSSHSPAPRACSAASYYFNAEIDQFHREWFEAHLRAMNEPSLSCGEQAAPEQYRFLWLRSFHHPIAIRVARTNTDIILEAVELDGAGGYEPSKPLRHIKKTLSGQEWRELKARLAATDFWNMPVTDEYIGSDGAQWIVEAREREKYHIVPRFSAIQHDFRKLGLYFLELSGFSIPGKEIY